MSLFRPEAVEHQRRRLYGAVTVHQPVSFSAFTALIVVGTLVTGIYLARGSIARKETVSGWITPQAGMAQVYSVKGGTATAVEVAEGDEVQAGAPLASLTLDVSGSEGGLAARERAQTAARMSELDIQLAQTGRTHDLELKRFREHAAALRAEAEQLRGQRAFQAQQLDIARQQLARVEPLLKKGFITAADRDQKAQAALAQQQALAELDRQIEARLADAADADAQARAVPTTAAEEASQLRGAKASLVQSMAELDVQASNVVRAPISGRVAYVNLHPGETVGSSVPLFAISPTSDKLEAELLVPTRSAGFIAKGQPVRLMVDAYSYQRFGVVKGVIDEVSRASLNPGQIAAPIEFKEPVYRVVVRLPPSAVLQAYGKDRPLQSGMTLKADILTDKRTFMEWMLDPLLAARKRTGA